MERALAIRNCYIKLDELFSKADRAQKSQNNSIIEQLESEYTANIINVENHSDYDYLCLRYSLRNNPNTTLPDFKIIDYATYFFEKGWRALVVMFYFILPFAIAFLWKIYSNVSLK